MCPDANPLSPFIVYPALEQSKNTQSLLNPIVFWKLPKWGTANVGCGEVSGIKACPEGDNKPKLLYKRCFRPECPVCYGSWANREASHGVERLEKGERVYYRVGKKTYRVRHIVFSPPQDEALKAMISMDGFKDLRSECVRVVKKAGIHGGCVIFHSHREKLIQGVSVWFYSPHFHILGYGYLMNAKDFFDLTGWVYKNKGVRKTVSGTVFYLLTHAGLGYVDDKRVFHSVTWFGSFGYSRLVIKSETRRVVYEECEVCGSNLHRYDVDYCKKSDYSDRKNWQDVGFYTHVERVRSFMLRDYKKHKVVFLKLSSDFG